VNKWVKNPESGNVEMGHIADLPADVVWLILRHAIYNDYEIWNGGSWIMRVLKQSRLHGFSLPPFSSTGGMNDIVTKYALVSRRWLSVIRSKVHPIYGQWKFVDGSWASFAL
jgi:hypothetical protein